MNEKEFGWKLREMTSAAAKDNTALCDMVWQLCSVASELLLYMCQDNPDPVAVAHDGIAQLQKDMETHVQNTHLKVKTLGALAAESPSSSVN